MKIQKTELIEAVKKVMPGVEKGSTIIEGADSVVLTGKTIHSYNDSISVSVPFDSGEVSGVFKGNEFFKLIQKLPEDGMELTPMENGIQIQSGGVTAELNLITADIIDYIKSMKVDEWGRVWNELPEDFWEGIRLCKINCSTSPNRGIFSAGSKTEGNLLISADGIRLNYYHLSGPVELFWIDDPAWAELVRLPGKIKEYSVDECWVHFRAEDGVIFSAKRKDEAYYPLEKLISIEETIKIEKSDIAVPFPKGIEKAIDRVAVLSEDINSFSAITVKIHKNKMVVESSRVSGKIKETLELPDGKYPEVEFKADADFLLEAVKKVSSFYFKNKEVPSILFHSDNFTQILATVTEE